MTRITMALAAAGLTALTACGNMQGDGDASPLGLARIAAAEVLGSVGRQGQAEPAAPARSTGDRVASALRANPGPLIMVGLESQGTTEILALVGENGGMRTYMTPGEQAVILRDGIIVGTRGLGNDLSVAEAEASAALIRAGRAGTAQRVMRYWTGDGLERPLTMDCSVGAGQKSGVMVETCRAGSLTVENSYLPQGGMIPVSRQWIGPALGYATVQVLRP